MVKSYTSNAPTSSLGRWQMTMTCPVLLSSTTEILAYVIF
jgi:hypothetical protein